MKRCKFLLPTIVLVLGLFGGSQAFAQIAWVKAFTPNSSKTTGTSIAVTVPAAGVAAGNSLIVSFAMDPASGTVSCTDSASTTSSAGSRR